MKIALKTTKPRNPFVAASLRRVAGAHGGNASSRRQRAQRELRNELQGESYCLRASP